MITTRRKLTRPFRKGARSSGDGSLLPAEALSRPQTPLAGGEEEEEEEQKSEQQKQYEREQEAHAAAVDQAREWLHDTIRRPPGRWTKHQLAQVRLECTYTWHELRQLGRLPRAEGVPKCQALVRVPVIYDEMGLYLWSTLAEMAASEAEEYDDKAAAAVAETRQKRPEAFLASRLDPRFRFDRSATSAIAVAVAAAAVALPPLTTGAGSGAAKPKDTPIEKEKTTMEGNSSAISPMGTTRIPLQRSASSPPPTSMSPPTSMPEAFWRVQHGCWACRTESIEEVPEEVPEENNDNNDNNNEKEINHEDQDDRVSMRGGVFILERLRLGRSGAGSFSNSTISSSSSARTGRYRPRSGSFGEKMSSIVGSLSKTVVTALGEGMPRGQGRRSPFLNRGRMGSS